MGCKSCGYVGKKKDYPSWDLGLTKPSETLVQRAGNNQDVLVEIAKGQSVEDALEAIVLIDDIEAIKDIIKTLNPEESFKGTGRRKLESWIDLAINTINEYHA